jgi:hypothetical protein
LKRLLHLKLVGAVFADIGIGRHGRAKF